jgi:alpha-amylase
MHTTFHPPSWVHHTNIYEVNIRQYTPEGTFHAFAKELARLKDMGIQVLWFMPVTPISQKNKKGSLGSYYACSDYTGINPEFGTMEDFKSLVKQAKDLGFKVIIDWVANHTGWDHRWTIEHPDYYKKDPDTHDFKMASGMEDIIELDFANPALRKAMIDAMQFWVNECDIDGFRCDLAFWVEVGFWKEARKELETGKHLFWLGEFDELESPAYGEAFDASYSWTWMHKTESFYKNKGALNDLLQILKRYDDLGEQCTRAWFTSNHDENSWNGTEYEKYGDMAMALAVFSATWNGIPLVYSGQEIPLKDHRLKFFDKDTIAHMGEYALHDFYKTLLHLHTHNPALRAGDPTVQTFILKTSNEMNVFAYLRKKDDNEVLVLLNFSSRNDHDLFILDENVEGSFKNIFSGKANDFGIGKKMEIRAWEYLVFER